MIEDSNRQSAIANRQSPSSLEVRNIGCLATPLGGAARRGKHQGEILRIRDAAVRAEEGRLVFVGKERDYAREFAGRAASVSLDAAGRAVIPGLVDAHTHPVWLGDRGAEIGQRLAGASYASIAANGGGIHATVRATRAGTDRELRDAVTGRLQAMLAHGTTTAEVKSGYGLTVHDEMRALRLLASLRAPDLPRLIPTLLAAHEIPLEFRENRSEWIRIVAEEIVPSVAREGIARFCDVFCEEGVYSVAESRRILEAARASGLGLRIHADELARSGGAMLGAELSAASADHLLFIEQEEIAALAAAGTVAVILPGTAWWMRSRPRAGAGVDRGGRRGGRGFGCEPRHVLHRVAARRRGPRVPGLGALGGRSADWNDAQRGRIARPRGGGRFARDGKVRRFGHPRRSR